MGRVLVVGMAFAAAVAVLVDYWVVSKAEKMVVSKESHWDIYLADLMDCVMADLSDAFAAVYLVVHWVAVKVFGKMVAVKGAMKVPRPVSGMDILKVSTQEAEMAIMSALLTAISMESESVFCMVASSVCQKEAMLAYKKADW